MIQKTKLTRSYTITINLRVVLFCSYYCYFNCYNNYVCLLRSSGSSQSFDFIFLQSFASVMADSSLITRMAVNLLIHQTKSQPFIKQTAKEFMFGYESPLVTLGNKFLPSWIAFDKLGLIDRVSTRRLFSKKKLFDYDASIRVGSPYKPHPMK